MSKVPGGGGSLCRAARWSGEMLAVERLYVHRRLPEICAGPMRVHDSVPNTGQNPVG